MQGEQTIGLGLFVSKQIISANQGKMDFVTVEGRGSTFIFTMKAEKPDTQEICAVEDL